jgi:hypothetical protein
MTGRERLMAILRQEKNVDRFAWAPLIDGYYMSSLPAGSDILAAFRDIGADVMERHVHTWCGTIDFRRDRLVREGLRKERRVDYVANGVTVQVALQPTVQGTELTQSYTIPGRTLTARSVFTETSPFLPFPVEHLIKDIDDLVAYRYIVEHEQYKADFDNFTVEDKRIGDLGIATDTALGSPIQGLLQHLIGIEPFYTVFLPDHREELLALMDAMHRSHCALCEIMAGSPAEVVIDYENTSTTFISPDLYEEFTLPIIDDYADIFHSRNKLFLTHRCGKLRALLPLLRRGRDDGIVDISPEPTGDLPIWEAKQALPGKVVAGGLDATFLAHWNPDQVVAYTREIMDRSGGPDRLIIGSADAVPKDARLDNMKAIGAAIAAAGG